MPFNHSIPFLPHKSLGIRQPICKALENKFHIRKPTECQISLIPTILQGKDVLIRDVTGSGKTFGMALALLNKTRNQQAYGRNQNRMGRPCITSLLVVPSRELAYQIENWMRVLLSDTGLPLKSIIQVVARTDPMDESRQLDDLESVPPHILVGTATRLHDLANAGHLSFGRLKTLVLDEADHLLRLPSKHATLKKLQNRQIHPKPAELLTQHVFDQAKPQIVVSSATLNRALRYYFKDNRYCEDPVFIDISEGTLSPPTIEHHCLLISTKEIKNITSTEFSWYNPFTDNHSSEVKEDIKDDDDLMLDSLIGALEFENVTCGIIFVNNQIKLPSLIKRLLKYGVEAKELEGSYMNQGEIKRKLFVAHEFTARGIDIPLVSHVFILGMPSSSIEYLHMSGRTGRMGRGGKVITFISEGRKRLIKTLFTLLKLNPSPYPHVQ
ncbi:6488_t:CDS:1 [Acaulospora colombiana]|uniref:6488_t:CDS:1 n=1 Tax=Acaulospora colombiana TaxID=27376 RepID=A0ACA9JZ01_9GLOM|nr:6488_t:CDS:1 [Acaulospora colombiana]